MHAHTLKSEEVGHNVCPVPRRISMNHSFIHSVSHSIIHSFSHGYDDEDDDDDGGHDHDDDDDDPENNETCFYHTVGSSRSRGGHPQFRPFETMSLRSLRIENECRSDLTFVPRGK